MMAFVRQKTLQLHMAVSHFFYLCLLLFLSNQLIEKMGIKIPFLYSYLDDLVAIPCTLGITLAIQRVFVFRSYAYNLKPWHVIYTVVFFSLYFEGYLPEVSSKHTRDFWDILCYALGGIAFYLWGMDTDE